MSADFSGNIKIVSPLKCNEKPWDFWAKEIGHLSPRREDEATENKAAAVTHPYKRARYRRAGISRLPAHTMGLHGLLPQMDNLNAAVCHMCGVVVKCCAAYRHLAESHSGAEHTFPPPAAPTVKLKTVAGRSRHKKDPLPLPIPTDPVPTSLEPAPPPDQEPPPAELQVCVETGELPVVSIQDTDDLPLGDNIADDIFEIMNSEGIQSADDIATAADWKNIIQDIGNMQDIGFAPPAEPGQPGETFPTAEAGPLHAYGLSDAELALQLAAAAAPPPTVAPPALAAPPPKSHARTKTGKSKFALREYDPNKHCGVVTAENPKPCTRSLTCKAHALSLRRTVEGRCKPFDVLLAEHRAARDAASAPPQPPPPTIAVVAPHPPPEVPPAASASVGEFAPLEPAGAPRPAGDIYASLLSAPENEAPAEEPRGDVCWYASSPRPLSVCTFNAAHAGGAITLGKRFATVRGSIKSALSRGCGGASGGATGGGGRGRAARPDVRRLVVWRGDAARVLSELLAGEVRLNGHVERRVRPKAPPPTLELGFSLDPLLADEKC